LARKHPTSTAATAKMPAAAAATGHEKVFNHARPRKRQRAAGGEYVRPPVDAIGVGVVGRRD
jgi:hypothetical protein